MTRHLGMLALTIMTYQPASTQDLNSHQWQHRLLLIITGGHDISLGQDAISTLTIDSTALVDRKIVLYQVRPTGFKRSTDGHWTNSEEIFKAYSQSDEPHIVLVGLDGAIKEKYPISVTPDTIWADIDVMPMRRSELKRLNPSY